MIDCSVLLQQHADRGLTSAARDVIVATLPMKVVPLAAMHGSGHDLHAEQTVLDTFALHHLYRVNPGAFVLLVCPAGTPSLFTLAASSPSAQGQTAQTLPLPLPQDTAAHWWIAADDVGVSALSAPAFFARTDVQVRTCQLTLAQPPLDRREDSLEGASDAGPGIMWCEDVLSQDTSFSSLVSGVSTSGTGAVAHRGVPSGRRQRRSSHRLFLAPRFASSILQAHPWVTMMQHQPPGYAQGRDERGEINDACHTAQGVTLRLLSLRRNGEYLFTCDSNAYESLRRQWEWLRTQDAMLPSFSGAEWVSREPLTLRQRHQEQRAHAHLVGVAARERAVQVHVLCTSSISSQERTAAVQTLLACLVEEYQRTRRHGVLPSEANCLCVSVGCRRRAEAAPHRAEGHDVAKVRAKGFLHDAVEELLEKLSTLPSPSQESKASARDEVYSLWDTCGRDIGNLRRDEYRRRMRNCEGRESLHNADAHATAHVVCLMHATDASRLQEVGVLDFVCGNPVFFGVAVSVVVLPESESTEALEEATLCAEGEEAMQRLVRRTGGRAVVLQREAGGRDAHDALRRVVSMWFSPPVASEDEKRQSSMPTPFAPATCPPQITKERVGTSRAAVTAARDEENPSPVRCSSTRPGSEAEEDSHATADSPTSSINVKEKEDDDDDCSADTQSPETQEITQLPQDATSRTRQGRNHRERSPDVESIDRESSLSESDQEEGDEGSSSSPPPLQRSEGTPHPAGLTRSPFEDLRVALGAGSVRIPSLSWCVFGSARCATGELPPTAVTSFPAFFSCVPPTVAEPLRRGAAHVRGASPSSSVSLASDCLSIHRFRDGVLTVNVAGSSLLHDEEQRRRGAWYAIALLVVEGASALMHLDKIVPIWFDKEDSAQVTFHALQQGGAYACVLCGFAGTAQCDAVHTDAVGVRLTAQDVLFTKGIAFRTAAHAIASLACKPVLPDAAADAAAALSVSWRGECAAKLLVDKVCTCVESRPGEASDSDEARLAREEEEEEPSRVVLAAASPFLLQGLDAGSVYVVKAVPLQERGKTRGGGAASSSSSRPTHPPPAVQSLAELRETPPAHTFALTLPSARKDGAPLVTQEVRDVVWGDGLHGAPAALMRFASPILTAFHRTGAAADASLQAVVTPLLSVRGAGEEGEDVGGEQKRERHFVDVMIFPGERPVVQLGFHLHVSMGRHSEAGEDVRTERICLLDECVPDSASRAVCEWAVRPFHFVSQAVTVEEVDESTAQLKWCGSASSYEVTVTQCDRLHERGDVAGSDAHSQRLQVEGVQSVLHSSQSPVYDASVTIHGLCPASLHTFSISCCGDAAPSPEPLSAALFDDTRTVDALEVLASISGTFATIARQPTWVANPRDLVTAASEAAVTQTDGIAVAATFDLLRQQLFLRLCRTTGCATGAASQVIIHVEPLSLTLDVAWPEATTFVGRIVNCDALTEVHAPLVVTLHEETAVASESAVMDARVAAGGPDGMAAALLTTKSIPLKLFILSDITCTVDNGTDDVWLRWRCGITPDTVTFNDVSFPLRPSSEGSCTVSLSTLLRCSWADRDEHHDDADDTGWQRRVVVRWTGPRLVPPLRPVILLPPPRPLSPDAYRLDVFGARALLFLSTAVVWRQYSEEARVPLVDSAAGAEEEASAFGLIVPLTLTLHVTLPDGAVLQWRVLPPSASLPGRDDDESLDHNDYGDEDDDDNGGNAPWTPPVFVYDMCLTLPLAFHRRADACLEVSLTGALAGPGGMVVGDATGAHEAVVMPLYFLPVATAGPVVLPVPPVLPILQLRWLSATPTTATIAWNVAAKEGGDVDDFGQDEWATSSSEASNDRDGVRSESGDEGEELLYEVLLIKARPTQEDVHVGRAHEGGARRRRSALLAASDQRREEIVRELTQLHVTELLRGEPAPSRAKRRRLLRRARSRALESLAGVFYVKEGAQQLTLTALDPATPYTVRVRCRQGEAPTATPTTTMTTRNRDGIVPSRIRLSEVVLTTPWDVCDDSVMSTLLPSVAPATGVAEGRLSALFPPVRPSSFSVFYGKYLGEAVSGGLGADASAPFSALLMPSRGHVLSASREASVPFDKASTCVPLTVSVCYAITLVSHAGAVVREWAAMWDEHARAAADSGALRLEWPPAAKGSGAHACSAVRPHLVLTAITETVVLPREAAGKHRARRFPLSKPLVPCPLPRARVDVVGCVALAQTMAHGCRLTWAGSCAAYRVTWLAIRFSAPTPDDATDDEVQITELQEEVVHVRDGDEKPSVTISEATVWKRMGRPRIVGSCTVLAAKIESANHTSNSVLVGCVLPPVIVADADDGKSRSDTGEPLRVLHRSAERTTVLLPPDGVGATSDASCPVAVEWSLSVSRKRRGPRRPRLLAWDATPSSDRAGGSTVLDKRCYDIFLPSETVVAPSAAPSSLSPPSSSSSPSPSSAVRQTRKKKGADFASETAQVAHRAQEATREGCCVIVTAAARVADRMHDLWHHVAMRLCPRRREGTPPEADSTRCTPLQWLSSEASSQRVVVVPHAASLRQLCVHDIAPMMASGGGTRAVPVEPSAAQLATIVRHTWDATEADLPLVSLSEITTLSSAEMAQTFGSAFTAWKAVQQPSQRCAASCVAVLSWISSDVFFVVDILTSANAVEGKEAALHVASWQADATPAAVAAAALAPSASLDARLYKADCLYTAARPASSPEASDTPLPSRRLFLSVAGTLKDVASARQRQDRRCCCAVPGLAPEQFYRMRIRGVATGDTALRVQFVAPPSPFAQVLTVERDAAQRITITSSPAACLARPRAALCPGVDGASVAAIVVAAAASAEGDGAAPRVSPRAVPLRERVVSCVCSVQNGDVAEGGPDAPGHADTGEREAADADDGKRLVFSLGEDGVVASLPNGVLVTMRNTLTVSHSEPAMAQRFLCVPLWGPLLIPQDVEPPQHPSNALGTATVTLSAESTVCRIPRLATMGAARLVARAAHRLSIVWQWESPPFEARQGSATSSLSTLVMRFLVTATPLTATAATTTTTTSTRKPESSEATQVAHAPPQDRCRVTVAAKLDLAPAHSEAGSCFFTLICHPSADLPHLAPGTLYRITIEAESAGPVPQHSPPPSPPLLPSSSSCTRPTSASTLPVSGRCFRDPSPSLSRSPPLPTAVATGCFSPGIESFVPSLARPAPHPEESRRTAPQQGRSREKLPGSIQGSPSARRAMPQLLIKDDLVASALVNARTGGRRLTCLALTAPSGWSAKRHATSPADAPTVAREGGATAEAHSASHLLLTLDGRVLSPKPIEEEEEATLHCTCAAACVTTLRYSMVFLPKSRVALVPPSVLAMVATHHQHEEDGADLSSLWRAWLRRAMHTVPPRKHPQRASSHGVAGDEEKKNEGRSLMALLAEACDATGTPSSLLQVRSLPAAIDEPAPRRTTHRIALAEEAEEEDRVLLLRCAHAFPADHDGITAFIGGDMALSQPLILSVASAVPPAEAEASEEAAVAPEGSSAGNEVQCRHLRLVERTRDALTVAWDVDTNMPPRTLRFALHMIITKRQRRLPPVGWRDLVGAPTVGRAIPMLRVNAAARTATTRLESSKDSAATPGSDPQRGDATEERTLTLSADDLSLTPSSTGCHAVGSEGGFVCCWTSDAAVVDARDGFALSLQRSDSADAGAAAQAAPLAPPCQLVVPPIDVPPPVARVVLTHATADSLGIAWLLSDGDSHAEAEGAESAAFYTVTCRTAGPADGMAEEDKDEGGVVDQPKTLTVPAGMGREASVTVQGLRPSMWYCITVTAHNVFSEAVEHGLSILTARTAPLAAGVERCATPSTSTSSSL